MKENILFLLKACALVCVIACCIKITTYYTSPEYKYNVEFWLDGVDDGLRETITTRGDYTEAQQLLKRYERFVIKEHEKRMGIE